MEKNAFVAGVERGGLTSQSEIKILICFILSEIGEPVSKSDLLEAFTEKGYANYFECADALTELLEAKHVSNHADGRYALTESGEEIAKMLSGDIPATVRERVTESAKKLHKRSDARNNIKSEIIKRERDYIVSCVISDSNDVEIFSFRAALPTRLSAQNARDRFLDSADDIAKDIFEKLTGETL